MRLRKFNWTYFIITFICAHTLAQTDINIPFGFPAVESSLNNETINKTYEDSTNDTSLSQESILQSSINQNLFQENQEVVNKSFIENLTNNTVIQFITSTADPVFNERFSVSYGLGQVYPKAFDKTASTAPINQNVQIIPEINNRKDDFDIKSKLNQNTILKSSDNSGQFTKPSSSNFYQTAMSTITSTEMPLTTQILFTNSENINDPLDLIKSSNIALKKERIFAIIGQTVNLTCGTSDITATLLAENGEGGFTDRESIMQKLSNQTIVSQWKLFWINSTENNADLAGTRVETTDDQVILIITVIRDELFKSLYTCQLQDPTNKIWNVKTVYLVKNASKALSLQTTSTMTPVFNGLRPNRGNNAQTSTRLITMSTTQMTNNYSPPIRNFNNDSKMASKNNTFMNNINFITPSLQTFEEDNKVFKTTKDDLFDEEVTKVQFFTTTRPNDTMDTFTEELTNASNSLNIEELGKAEEQRLIKKEIIDLDSSSSGVALGVALAALMAGAGTALVLYRRRKVSKKSNYITFGNPSYSRENLPANDYSLESPLTLSSNGYTVLA